MSPSEIKAYTSCLDLGSSTASEIAKNVKLNRSNCYEALKRLMQKGLISTIQRERKTLFESANPKKLFELIKTKEVEVNKLIPELEKRQKISKRPNHTATVFEGYEGIKSVFEDILYTLNKGDDYLVFGAVDVPKTFERYLVHWTKRRVAKRVQLKIIFHEDAKSFIEKTKTAPLTELKVLPKSYITPAAVNIYGDKTATIVWTETPIAFVVQNKEYTESFRSYFQLLWNIAK